MLVVYGRRGEDGAARLFVRRWPPKVFIDAFFLATADPSHVSRDGDMVTFRVQNGQATYQVVQCELSPTWHGRLVSSRLSEEG